MKYSGANLFYSVGNPFPEPGSYAANYRFQATVTITDVASGQSIDQVWNGAYTSQWSYPPEYADQPELWYWEFERSRFGDEMDKRNFMLGNNRYTVWANGGGQGLFPMANSSLPSIRRRPRPNQERSHWSEWGSRRWTVRVEGGCVGHETDAINSTNGNRI